MTYLFDKKISYDHTPNLDAFGRLRVSNPFTLFDSHHRYRDNDKSANYTQGTANVVYNSDAALMEMNVGNTMGDLAYRESKRVFVYQPGKSLLILRSFAFNTGKAGLRQRIGYFSTRNGFYFEQDGTTLNMVRRGASSGSVVETRVPQSAWNGDRLDGSLGVHNPSKLTLYPNRSQILFVDVEWLGVGDARMGFVINGQFYVVHTFHHANEPSTANVDTSLTYMTTASLPIRTEIENTANTAGPSHLHSICSTVISEGGYTITGSPRTIGRDTSTPVTLTAANVFYPVVSIRLNNTYPNAVVLPVDFALLGIDSGNYRFKLVKDANVIGGSWVSMANTSIDYNITSTSALGIGGDDLDSGYFATTAQASGGLPNETASFRFQLERNPFTNVSSVFSLCVLSDGATDRVVGSITFEEVT
jgi:hypothetical protein